MNQLWTPSRTLVAVQWLERGVSIDRVKQALLSSFDGHRNVTELQGLARALGLEADALHRLRHEGLIDLST